MREYDDDVRLYTPVLQRIIILVAVFVAVPVVLWTITAFVRTYVGPPQIPTFQRMTAVQPSDNTTKATKADPAPIAAPIPPPAPAPSQAAVTPAPSLAASASPAGDQTQAGNAPIVTPVATPQVVIATTQPTISLAAPPPAAAQPTPAPPTTAAIAVAPSAAAPDTTDDASPATSDRSFAWPNASTSPATNGAAAGATAADGQIAASSDDGSDALPAAAPITGRVPLPRRRPNVVAMMETAQVGLPLRGVPLPRARPTDAPATTPEPVNDAPIYDRDAAH